jgi:hypothetical protein
MRTALILALFCLAASLIASAKKEETLEQLVSRAQSAKVQDQPELYTEAAERQLAAADKLYTAGQIEEARSAVHDVVTFSDRAAEAANTSGKHIKHTEISFRKMAAKLRDIKRALAFEDQPPVQDAANHLEELRTNLLTRMFGKEEK